MYLFLFLSTEVPIAPYATTSVSVPAFEFFAQRTTTMTQRRLVWGGDDPVFRLHSSGSRSETKMEDKDWNATIFGARLTQTQVQVLKQVAVPSLVGKNEKTVLDENIRKSLEIPASELALNVGFLTQVEKQVEEMRQILMHPVACKPVLHKCIVYRPGDEFQDVRLVFVAICGLATCVFKFDVSFVETTAYGCPALTRYGCYSQR